MRVASTLLLVILSASAAGATTDEVVLDFAPEADGAKYKEALVTLIRKSDRVVVTEHSDPFDFFDAVTGESEIAKTIVYGEHELTVAQKEFFSTTIENLDPKTQDAFSSCIPSVHHTFYFYNNDHLTDKIDVCFQCSQVIWLSTKVVPPWSLYPGLKRVLVAFGFTPKRDWPRLARESLK
jgi:hypothetical protein